tara:strand:+ start:225 stop:488 length:264 start_codon:yes stop_codon:yes gene_type:complete
MESGIANLLMLSARPTLKEAQDMVGGYVELIWLDSKTQMLVNEEGAYDDSLLFNPMATRLAEKAGYCLMKCGIRGDAVVLTGDAVWD